MAVDTIPGDGWTLQIASGISRGTTTSSGVITVDTGLDHEVLAYTAWHEGGVLRNSNADPAAGTGVGTFNWFIPITVNPTAPTTARFRVIRDKTLSAASSVSTLGRSLTLGSAITAVVFRWFAWGR